MTATVEEIEFPLLQYKEKSEINDQIDRIVKERLYPKFSYLEDTKVKVLIDLTGLMNDSNSEKNEKKRWRLIEITDPAPEAFWHQVQEIVGLDDFVVLMKYTFYNIDQPQDRMASGKVALSREGAATLDSWLKSRKMPT